MRGVRLSWPTVTWAALGALALAAVGLLLGVAGGMVGSGQGSVTVALWMRGLLTLVGVVVVSRVLLIRADALGLANPMAATAWVAAAGYGLEPLTWNGRAVATQLLLDPGAATVVGDLALWLVAAGVGILWGARGLDAEAGYRGAPGRRSAR